MRSPLMMRIDRIACDGRGTCGHSCPSSSHSTTGVTRFSPTVRYPETSSLAHAAVELCPKMALQLRVGEEGVTAQG